MIKREMSVPFLRLHIHHVTKEAMKMGQSGTGHQMTHQIVRSVLEIVRHSKAHIMHNVLISEKSRHSSTLCSHRCHISTQLSLHCWHARISVQLCPRNRNHPGHLTEHEWRHVQHNICDLDLRNSDMGKGEFHSQSLVYKSLHPDSVKM
jgi:hypothetical protein